MSERLIASLSSVAAASLVAARAADLGKSRHPSARKVFVHLGERIGDPAAADMADVLALTDRSVRRLAARRLSGVEEEQLQAARLVLSDPRLLKVLPADFNSKGAGGGKV
jgi:hypothetical protein